LAKKKQIEKKRTEGGRGLRGIQNHSMHVLRGGKTVGQGQLCMQSKGKEDLSKKAKQIPHSFLKCRNQLVMVEKDAILVKSWGSSRK